MVTSIEVLDTAVKIGLGALITGLAGHFTARLSIKKDRVARRGKIMESVAVEAAKASEIITSGDKSLFGEFRYKIMPSIEAKLLLLGEKRSVEELRAWRNAGGIWLCGLEEGRFDDEEMMRERVRIFKLQDEFFGALSRAYKRA